MKPLSWTNIENWVINGIEGTKIEIKQEFKLDNKPNRAKFAQLITAIANAPGGTGYFIIGVVDKRNRKTNSLDEIVPGVTDDHDSYQRLIQQALDTYASPVPVVEYLEVPVPEIGRKIGVVIVRRSRNRPHEITRESDSVKPGTYIRRGAETYPATEADVRIMKGTSSQHAIIVNFSHPISEELCQQICSKTNLYIAEVVEPPKIPVNFDEEKEFEQQVREVVDKIGLTIDEWQELYILVNVPGFAPITAALIAEMHGRMGHFPKVLRLKRSQDNSNRYEFAEIIELQRVRDFARQRKQTDDSSK